MWLRTTSIARAIVPKFELPTPLGFQFRRSGVDPRMGFSIEFSDDADAAGSKTMLLITTKKEK